MASQVSVKIDGLDGIKAAMRELSNQVNTRIARSATLAGSRVIRDATAAAAPVDTGVLKKNVIIKRLPRSALTSQFIVTVRQGKRTKKQIERGVGDAFYAKFVEFGTVNAPAKKFIRPSFDNNKEAAAQKIVESLKTGIARATK